MNKFTFKKLFLFISFLVIPVLCFAQNSSDKKWIIAAQKFEYSKGQSQNAVTQAMESTLPSDILEKMNKTLQRNIYPDEQLERTRYKLRTERQSLYLQLSSEYNKRDALVLQNLSEAKLQKSIKDQEKKIEDIKTKITENLNTLREEEDKLEAKMQQAFSKQPENSNEISEFSRLKNMAKRIFIKDKNVITTENISFYRDNIYSLYTPSEADLLDGFTGYKFEKSVCSAGINTLLTGIITQYGDYVSVQVEMYIYPGAKKMASVIEMGTIQDLDLLTTSIANQLIPQLTNSMPVTVAFSVNSNKYIYDDDETSILQNELPLESVQIFIDDVLQNTDGRKIDLQSGVHIIQFACEGYNTAQTSYYFEGNKAYNIDVNLVPKQEGILTLQLKKTMEGSLLVNGIQTETLQNNRTQIKINGNNVLGEFIAENKETAFFYIPIETYEKMYSTSQYIEPYAIINPKPFNRDEYIDTRRKWMYGAYSSLMVSLIPFFVTSGILSQKVELYKQGQISYEDAKKWQEANNICAGISIGCGVFWGVELVRYLFAANSVLPQEAKKGE